MTKMQQPEILCDIPSRQDGVPRGPASRVLIVDDQRPFAFELAFELEARSVQVHVASTMRDALALVRRSAYSVVVLGLDAEVAAITTLSEQRRSGSEVPRFVVVRGRPSEELVRAFRADPQVVAVIDRHAAVVSVAAVVGLLLNCRPSES